ncbi:MAG: hypothetical protein GY950_13295, partial [bacterium]|nr:hypothetical protein [bacterium]
MNHKKLIGVMLIFFFLWVSCGEKAEEPVREETKVTKETRVEGEKMGVIEDYEDITVVKKRMSKIAPVEVTFDASVLSESEKKALDLIVKA